MIDVTSLVNNVGKSVGLWCPAVVDDIDLAKMAECASNTGVGTVSVVPGAIRKMWPWLEQQNVKIIARFYVAPARTLQESVLSDLVKNIKSAFRNGAAGAQVFVPLRLLPEFAREMRVVRNDLFFNRELIIGLDIGEIGCDDWQTVFDALIDLRADSLLLVHATGGESAFVGGVYAMLNDWNANFMGRLSWMLNDSFYSFEQALRLTRSICPDLLDRTMLLVNADDK